MGWFQKSMPISGSVLFRGSLPPKLSDLRLPPGTTVTPRATSASAHWHADATSPTLGDAELVCLRDPPSPPRELVEFDCSLTDAEKEGVALGRTLVSVRIQPSKAGHLLRDRKRLLTWLGAIFDEDAVIALDHSSTRPWSRGMLDDELAHDADVDVTALYALHAITGSSDDGGDDNERCQWLHTHGLAELGKIDFDILKPAQALTENASDLVRALAFAVLEDRLKAGADWVAFQPGGALAAVDARTFDAHAPADERAIRDMGPGDESHRTDRIVLVDPTKRGLLSRLIGKKQVQASRALMNFPDDRAIVFFSHDASALAAERARKTWGQFRAFREEFADLRFPAIVKLGYQVDGGDESDLEHLWFEVHDAGDDWAEATLMNEPFNISAMQAGQRGRHPVMERLTDWMLMTPMGTVTPRSTSALRSLRTNPAARLKLLEFLAQSAAENGTGATDQYADPC